MKTRRRIFQPFPMEPNESARRAFAEFCRENGIPFQSRVDLSVEIDEDDSRFQGLLDVLIANGFELKPHHVLEEMRDEANAAASTTHAIWRPQST